VSTTFAMGAYTATKHAVVGIGATLQMELTPTGVGVTILCPGSFKTRIFESERNCPSGFDVRPDAAPDEVVSLYKGVVADSPDPSVAADALHDAVVSNRLFVFPSPEVNPLISDRLAAVRDALQEPATSDRGVAR
jgi:short-subunit dehydrogenase